MRFLSSLLFYFFFSISVCFAQTQPEIPKSKAPDSKEEDELIENWDLIQDLPLFENYELLELMNLLEENTP